MKPFAFLLALCSVASAAEPNGGYYQGLSILYPYTPVFCDQDSGAGGPCFGMPGAHLFLPRSAPLPPGYKHCRWADPDNPKARGDGWVSASWYQWEPRIIQLYGADAQVCYLEDRGEPRNINDLPRDE